jgi:hypothetical protein
MFVDQHISADFLTKDLLQQLGGAFWIGLERIRNQRDQKPDLTCVRVNVYSSAAALVAGPFDLDVEPDATQPELLKAGYLLQTGPGQTLTLADTYTVVYSARCKTGEVGLFQQSFAVRAAPPWKG